MYCYFCPSQLHNTRICLHVVNSLNIITDTVFQSTFNCVPLCAKVCRGFYCLAREPGIWRMACKKYVQYCPQISANSTVIRVCRSAVVVSFLCWIGCGPTVVCSACMRTVGGRCTYKDLIFTLTVCLPSACALYEYVRVYYTCTCNSGTIQHSYCGNYTA